MKQQITVTWRRTGYTGLDNAHHRTSMEILEGQEESQIIARIIHAESRAGGITVVKITRDTITSEDITPIYQHP